MWGRGSPRRMLRVGSCWAICRSVRGGLDGGVGIAAVVFAPGAGRVDGADPGDGAVADRIEHDSQEAGKCR